VWGKINEFNLITMNLEDGVDPENLPSLLINPDASIISCGFSLHIPDDEKSTLVVMVSGHGQIVGAHPVHEGYWLTAQTYFK
jgi:hypothetical protein